MISYFPFLFFFLYVFLFIGFVFGFESIISLMLLREV